MKFQVDFNQINLKLSKTSKFIDVLVEGNSLILCAICDEGSTAVAVRCINSDVQMLSFRLPVLLWNTVIVNHKCLFTVDADEIYCAIDDNAIVSTPISTSNYFVVSNTRSLIAESKDYPVEDISRLGLLVNVVSSPMSLITIVNGMATVQLENVSVFLEMPYSSDYSIYCQSLKYLLSHNGEVHKTRDNLVSVSTHQASVVPLASKTLPCDYNYLMSQTVLAQFTVDFSKSVKFLRKLKGYHSVLFDINSRKLVAEMEGAKCQVDIDVIGLGFGEFVSLSFPAQLFLSLMLKQSLYAFTVKLTKRAVISVFSSGVVICHRRKIK